MQWKVQEYGRNLHAIHFPISATRDQNFLLMSDVHFDSVKCDRKLLKAHLDEAKEIGAIVLDNGDFFDAMQGKRDPRSDSRLMRPEYVGKPQTYFEALVEEAAEFLDPYKDILGLRGIGNHEEAITIHSGYNLTQALVDRLRIAGARNVFMGGMSGYIVLRAMVSTTGFRTLDLHYFHGAGMDPQVTKGAIEFERMRASHLADIYWSGHIHRMNQFNEVRIMRTKEMAILQKEEAFVRTPGYKDDYGTGEGGWGVMRGHKPKPRGGYWLRVFRIKSSEALLGFDFRSAK